MTDSETAADGNRSAVSNHNDQQEKVVMADAVYHKRPKAAINTVARAIARDAVKQEIWDRGRKLDYRLDEFAELVQMYLNLCPQVYDQAAEIVRNHPKFRTLAERQACKRKGNQA